MFPLPNDLTNHILSFITDKELTSSRRVSKQWHKTIIDLTRRNEINKLNLLVNLVTTTIGDFDFTQFQPLFEKGSTIQQIRQTADNLKTMFFDQVFQLSKEKIERLLPAFEGKTDELIVTAFDKATKANDYQLVKELNKFVKTNNLAFYDIKIGTMIKNFHFRDAYFFDLSYQYVAEEDYNKIFNIMLNFTIDAFIVESARRLVHLLSDTNPHLLNIFAQYVVVRAESENNPNEIKKFLEIGNILCPKKEQ